LLVSMRGQQARLKVGPGGGKAAYLDTVKHSKLPESLQHLAEVQSAIIVPIHPPEIKIEM